MAIIVLPRAASQRAQRDMRWSGGSSFFQGQLKLRGQKMARSGSRSPLTVTVVTVTREVDPS